MSRKIKLAAAVGVAALGIAAVAAPAAGARGPSITVSFATGGGATLGWSAHHSGFTATLPGTSSYAVIELRHTSSEAPAAAPTLATDNYATGSPRWYLQFSGGDYLFGYPNGLWDTEGPNVGFHYGLSYADAVGYMGTESITSAQVVMDASQPVPATDHITELSYSTYTVGG
jgi:hypothetical protein